MWWHTRSISFPFLSFCFLRALIDFKQKEATECTQLPGSALLQLNQHTPAVLGKAQDELVDAAMKEM
jgi:hypothetical protein